MNERYFPHLNMINKPQVISDELARQIFIKMNLKNNEVFIKTPQEMAEIILKKYPFSHQKNFMPEKLCFNQDINTNKEFLAKKDEIIQKINQELITDKIWENENKKEIVNPVIAYFQHLGEKFSFQVEDNLSDKIHFFPT